MPTVPVNRDYFFSLIGKTYTQREFEDVCFEFGIELDDVTSEKEMFMREQGNAGGNTSGAESSAAKLSDEVIYKIDTPANRYDLLSTESLAMALKVFLGIMPHPPVLKLLHRSSPLYTMVVKKSVKNVRDYVVCAVLKDIQFNAYSYNSFIELQERLHLGLARRRTLASVGTHDLDKIIASNSRYSREPGAAGGEFVYAAKPKADISFVPLRNTKVMHCAGNGLEEFFEEDRHIKKYCGLISSLPCYPVIMDAGEEHVLSLPPIINSRHSAIDANTRNVFIECTAPDHYKAEVLVNQLVAAFAPHCAEPFTVEAVKVVYEEPAPDGTTEEICPRVDPTAEITVSLQKTNRLIGIALPSADAMAVLLRRMLYTIKSVSEDDGGSVTVAVPCYRSDVLGPPDVMEDVAIAYGYDNMTYEECTTHGAVTQTPLSKLSHLLRLEIAAAGYVELLTYSLCSRADAFENLQRVDQDVAVHLTKPKTVEFQVMRPSLLVGLLKALSANKSSPLPQRYFECADVVLIDSATNFPPALRLQEEEDYGYPSPGARNQRNLALLHCNAQNSAFEEVHSAAEYTLRKLGLVRLEASMPADAILQYFKKEVEGSESRERCYGYTLERARTTDVATEAEYVEANSFFPGRAMTIYLHKPIVVTEQKRALSAEEERELVRRQRKGEALEQPPRRVERVEKIAIGHLGALHPNVLEKFDIPFACSAMEVNIQFLCTQVA